MSKKVIESKQLANTLDLTLLSDGYWLYDKTQGMNLSMRANTAEAAFVEALTYYQRRLAIVESEHKELEHKVNGFLQLFTEDGELPQ